MYHAYIHTHACTYAHTCIHTHTHTHICRCCCGWAKMLHGTFSLLQCLLPSRLMCTLVQDDDDDGDDDDDDDDDEDHRHHRAAYHSVNHSCFLNPHRFPPHNVLSRFTCHTHPFTCHTHPFTCHTHPNSPHLTQVVAICHCHRCSRGRLYHNDVTCCWRYR